MRAIWMGCLTVAASAGLGQAPQEPQEVLVFNDNGGWCWFEDERVIVHDGKLIIGTVADEAGAGGEARKGHIEATIHDLATGENTVVVLHEHLQDDDHNSPAFLPLADGRLLALYAKHGSDRLIRVRTTATPDDPTTWTPVRTLERPAGVTYSNLHRLTAEGGATGRIYNFYRGEGWDPNIMVSDDEGETWSYGGRVFGTPFGQGGRVRPYMKYASDGVDTIHFVTSEAHPRDHPETSLFHGFLRDGKIHKSDGTVLGSPAEGPIDPTALTKVFDGDPNNRAWTVDLHLDPEGHPVTVYTVHKSDEDLRFRYARFDGERWRDHEIAYAGKGLYPGEMHYTGLAALDPDDLSRLFISTDADPVTGAPLISQADGQRHHEIFEGRTTDGGATWTWTPITQNSTVDNLRPIVPKWDAENTALLWLSGTYTTYQNYDQRVVGLIWRGER